MRDLPTIGLVMAALLTGIGCRPAQPLDQAETAYQEARFFADQLDVTHAIGADTSRRGVAVAELTGQYRAARTRLGELLLIVDTTRLGDQDLRAFRAMALAMETSLTETPAPAIGSVSDGSGSCQYRPGDLLGGPDGESALVARIIHCYGLQASDVRLGGERLDRLTVFGLLGDTEDPARRRRLFLALDPVWRSVNADDGGSTSPWRLVLQLRAEQWRATGYPHESRAAALGISADSVEVWLERILTAWRSSQPEELVEPWDWYYQNGEASRRLSPLVPLDSLLAINRAVFAALGADPDLIGVEYDIEPRPGKYPVAYSTFGARTRMAGGQWVPGEPWVFASYRVGGIGSLGELLHETGHAIHIGAVRTRPAFNTWPDSDTFTEAVADLVSQDLFEPAWQQRWLGDSVSRTVALRGQYGSVMLDLAWALFEIRMFRAPEQSPNQVWAEITAGYLGIRPHPEWSWWAQRGQLVESPGYMLNYALGAILVAQLRDQVRAARPVGSGVDDPGWYPWVSDRLYRFGLERPTAEVVAEFLGGPVSPNAILADLKAGSPGLARGR